MPAIIVASLALLSGASALRVPPKLPERAPPSSAQKHAAVVTAAVLAIGAAQPPDAAFAAFGLPLLGTAPAATTAAANAAATAEAAAAAATAANAATSTSDFDAAEAWSKLSAFARDTASVAKQAAGAAKDAYEDERTQAALKVAGKVAGTTLDVAGEGFKLATSAAERDRVATEVNALPGKAASSVAKGLGETASVAASALGDVASVAVDAVTSTPVVKQQLDDFARAQAETDALIARNARAVLNDPLVSQALSTSRAVLNDPATQAALTTTQEALTTGAIATGSALSDSLTAFSEAVTTEGGLSKLIDAKYTEISKAIATETPKLAESLKDSGMSAAEVAAKAAADAALQAAGFAQQEADKALAEFGKVAEAELKEQSASLDPAVAKQLSDATQLAYQAVQVSGEVAQKTAQLAKEAADAYQASEIAEVLAKEQGDLSRARPKLKERLQQRLAVRLPQLQSEAEKLSRQAQAQLVEAYKQGDEAARGAVAEATKTAELEAKKLIDGSSPELKSIITSSPEVEKALIRYAPEVTKALKSVADVVGPTTQAAADSLIASLTEYREKGYLSIGSVQLRAGMPLTELSPQLSRELMSAAQELANAKGGNELLDSLSAASKDGGDSASAIYVKALANGVTLGVEATGKVFGERVLPALSSGLDEVAKSADVGSSMSKLSSQTQGLLSSAQTALGKVAKDTEQLKAQAEELKGQADVVTAQAKVKLDEVNVAIEKLKAQQAADREAARAAELRR